MSWRDLRVRNTPLLLIAASCVLSAASIAGADLAVLLPLPSTALIGIRNVWMYAGLRAAAAVASAVCTSIALRSLRPLACDVQASLVDCVSPSTYTSPSNGG